MKYESAQLTVEKLERDLRLANEKVDAFTSQRDQISDELVKLKTKMYVNQKFNYGK